MTPFEFKEDFTTIGGSHNRIRGELTEKGRPKIGSKGIGFLAVARYCSCMEIVSKTTKLYSGKIFCQMSKKVDISGYLELPISREVLSSRLRVNAVYIVRYGEKERLSQESYIVDGIMFEFCEYVHHDQHTTLEIHYEINFSDIEIKAIIDFDYLLSLENQADLGEIDDFCTVEVNQISDLDRVKEHYTKITLKGLKPFVVSDLQTVKRSGNVRNMASLDGVTQFVWELSRCIPVEYDLPPDVGRRFGELLKDSRLKYIKRVIFSGGVYSNLELRRPIWGTGGIGKQNIEGDICVEVNICDNGLVASGYILGQTEAIFPAEYRGLTVRVRNVAIGQPGFLGLEKLLAGKHKATLSQITGEINILEGMDAIDALNPGRESFYEENFHYKKLRECIAGNGESLGGLLGRVIQGVLRRSQVTSNVREYINRANIRRKALRDISGAINYLATSTDFSGALRSFFSNTEIIGKHLPECRNYGVSLLPDFKVSNFRVEDMPGLMSDSVIDFEEQKIYFDFSQERWSWRLYILGKYYGIVNKAGKHNDPICEIDTQSQKIYINWNHPVREQMDEKSFIKSAIAWRLAHHVCVNNIDKMMSLGLRVLSYSV